jgi:hypothetical protein
MRCERRQDAHKLKGTTAQQQIITKRPPFCKEYIGHSIIHLLLAAGEIPLSDNDDNPVSEEMILFLD